VLRVLDYCILRNSVVLPSFTEIPTFVHNMAFAHVLSSSDDEDFANIINRRPKNVRRQPAHFDEFDDMDFHARF